MVGYQMFNDFIERELMGDDHGFVSVLKVDGYK